MSPEYRVEIALPFVFTVEAASKEDAEEQALTEMVDLLIDTQMQGQPSPYALPDLNHAVVTSIVAIDPETKMPLPQTDERREHTK